LPSISPRKLPPGNPTNTTRLVVDVIELFALRTSHEELAFEGRIVQSIERTFAEDGIPLAHERHLAVITPRLLV
jgi:hypothetical protein